MMALAMLPPPMKAITGSWEDAGLVLMVRYEVATTGATMVAPVARIGGLLESRLAHRVFPARHQLLGPGGWQAARSGARRRHRRKLVGAAVHAAGQPAR